MSSIRFADIEKLWRERPFLFAAVAAMLAALFAASFLHNRERELLHQGEMLPVLVAARDIAAGELVTSDRLTLARIPRHYVAVDALSDVTLAGMIVARVPLPQGNQITRAVTAPVGVEGGLAANIPAGKRAVAVAVDDVSGVAGLVKPGDVVDLLVTFDFGNDAASKISTVTVLEAVPVLAVGTDVSGDLPRLQTTEHRAGMFDVPHTTGDLGHPRQATVTLALAPQEVQQAVFAQEAGTVTLALHARGDGAEAVRTMPTTIRDIAGTEELLRARRGSYREYRGR